MRKSSKHVGNSNSKIVTIVYARGVFVCVTIRMLLPDLYRAVKSYKHYFMGTF